MRMQCPILQNLSAGGWLGSEKPDFGCVVEYIYGIITIELNINLIK